MMQTEYAQQDSLANRLNIVDALVKRKHTITIRDDN